MPDPANAAVCLCSHGANYHADWRARVSVLNDGQIGRTHQAEQNVGAFVNASVENPEALSQGLKEGGSETEAQQGLDAAGGNAASRDEQLDFGQLPNDSGPVASKQSLPEGEGELQNCVGHRVGMEAGSRDREGVSEAVEESDSRKETTGLDSHWVELTLKANEPTQKRQALGAQEDPQGMGNIEVPDPPTATRKRPSVLRELETRLRLDSPRATASMPQGQGKPVQNTSPISKRGRPLEPPSAWWGNQIGALWPYSKKQASGLRKKRAKALKSPDEQSSSAAVPNAQRCTRNDGKYWQCGNERASGRKLCEYHWQYEMKRRKRRAEAMGAVSKKKAGVEVTGAGGASKKRRADVGAYLAVDGTSSAKEPLGVRSQGGAEWIRKEFIGAVKARRARGDDVSRGPKGTRVRASTRRWWEANGSEATGEPKEKRSPGLPFLEENALEGEAVEAVGAGEQ